MFNLRDIGCLLLTHLYHTSHLTPHMILVLRQTTFHHFSSGREKCGLGTRLD